MNKLMQLLRDNASRDRKPLSLVRSQAGETTLYVYDVIDAYWGVSAQMVADVTSSLTPQDTLHVRINSPGGDVFEARAIAANLRGFGGKVIAHIDALAASAATTVALAASEVLIDPQAFFMIHNSWSIAIGNKAEMTKMATLLDKIDTGIVADYASRTGQPVDQITAWMDAETWFTAQEAVDNGFANRLSEAAAAPADAAGRQFNLAAYERPPAALLARQAANQEATDMAAMHAHNQRRMRLFHIA